MTVEAENKVEKLNSFDVSEGHTPGKTQTVATHLSQAIDITELESTYDTNVKLLLSNKQILALILKYSVREFADVSLDTIRANVENNIEVGTRPVDAGLSNTQRITGTSTEDSVPREGTIVYDIRFSVTNGTKFLINVEAQRSSDHNKLGYHLENRIMFYLARMMSAQKDTEFTHINYDDIKPVVSIFICMDRDAEEYEITEIGLKADTVFGEAKRDYNTDLMRGIIIRLRSGKNLQETSNKLINVLETLLSSKDAKTKKAELERHGLKMTVELERRISEMCNLSLNIREEGIEQGIEQERHNAVKRMLQNDFKKEQILLLGYTESEYEEAEKELLTKV